MSLYLVHLRPGIGPVGVWVQHPTGDLESFYDPDTPEHECFRDRAQAAIDARGSQVPWHIWARNLTGRTPYFDDYVIEDDEPGTPLPVILTRLRSRFG